MGSPNRWKYAPSRDLAWLLFASDFYPNDILSQQYMLPSLTLYPLPDVHNSSGEFSLRISHQSIENMPQQANRSAETLAVPTAYSDQQIEEPAHGAPIEQHYYEDFVSGGWMSSDHNYVANTHFYGPPEAGISVAEVDQMVYIVTYGFSINRELISRES